MRETERRPVPSAASAAGRREWHSPEKTPSPENAGSACQSAALRRARWLLESSMESIVFWGSAGLFDISFSSSETARSGVSRPSMSSPSTTERNAGTIAAALHRYTQKRREREGETGAWIPQNDRSHDGYRRAGNILDRERKGMCRQGRGEGTKQAAKLHCEGRGRDQPKRRPGEKPVRRQAPHRASVKGTAKRPTKSPGALSDTPEPS